MLRKQFAKIFKNEHLKKKVLGLLSLISAIGFIWMLCMGKVSEPFPVNDLGLKSYVKEILPFNKDSTSFLYENIDKVYPKLEKNSKIIYLYETLKGKLNYESYIVPYKDQESGYEGENLITYIRSAKGMGLQCNLLAFPINKYESVRVGIGFIHHWKEQHVYYQHKDLIILFYEETSYSISIDNFLKQYLSESEFFPGRCGTIRHAFILSEESSIPKQVAVVSEGKNYNLNDQNLYYVTKNALKVSNLKFDINYPYSFTGNQFWRNLLSSTTKIRSLLHKNFESLFQYLELMSISIPFSTLTSPIIFLDSLKNQLFGNLHYPHTQFLEKGIYSITFLLNSEGSSKNIENYCGMLDVLLLTLDDVDTHEHSGTMQYFFADKERHVTIKTYPYPILTFTLGLILQYVFLLPVFLRNHGRYFLMSMIVVLLTHLWGLTIFYTSTGLLAYLSGNQLLSYPFEKLSLESQSKYFENLHYSLISSILISTIGVFILYKFSKFAIVYSSEGKCEASTNGSMKILSCCFVIGQQITWGLMLHPAYSYFTALVFLTPFGINPWFKGMKAKEKAKNAIFICAYLTVLYSFCHFDYESRLSKVAKGTWTGVDTFLGEMYRDAHCTGNSLLFFIWAGWIPNAINFVIATLLK